MPLLGNCCFFLDLKVGTLIIGVLTLLSDIGGTLFMAIMSVAFEIIMAAFKSVEQTWKDELDATRGTAEHDHLAEAGGNLAMNWIQNNLNIIKILVYFLLTLQLLLVVVDSMLIHGCRNSRRRLLFPWIIVTGIKAGVLLILAIAMLSIFAGTGNTGDASVDGMVQSIILTAVSFFFWPLLLVYFILVVVSQYEALGIINMHDEMSMK